MYKYIIYTQCILPLKYIHNYKFLLDMLFKCHLKIKINVQCDSNKIKQWSPSHLQIVLTVSYRIFSVSLSVFLPAIFPNHCWADNPQDKI